MLPVDLHRRGRGEPRSARRSVVAWVPLVVDFKRQVNPPFIPSVAPSLIRPPTGKSNMSTDTDGEVTDPFEAVTAYCPEVEILNE